MTDFTSARINMVDSQIHTMGVIEQNVLNAFRTVPREEYLPASHKSIAYGDEDLMVSPGRYVMEPVTHARLVQAVLPGANDRALDFGVACGYSSAILSALCAHVTAVEGDENLLSHAKAHWLRLGLVTVDSVSSIKELRAEGFDIIILNGSVSHIGDEWKKLLAKGGRLATIVKGADDRIGRAVLLTKNAAGVCGERILFDASVPYLPGYQPRKEFVF